MFCDRCGARLQPDHRFCPACGKPLASIPLMPVQSRIAGHIRLLGILWLALSAMLLMGGFVMTAIFSRGAWWYGNGFPPGMPLFVHHILQTVGAALLGGGVLGIVAGWGLLERQSWARTLAIVLACFALLLFMPFGTALGIYTLWVLLPAQSEEEYRKISRAA